MCEKMNHEPVELTDEELEQASGGQCTIMYTNKNGDRFTMNCCYPGVGFKKFKKHFFDDTSACAYYIRRPGCDTSKWCWSCRNFQLINGFVPDSVLESLINNNHYTVNYIDDRQK